MVLVNLTTKFATENVNIRQASMIIDVKQSIVLKWSKEKKVMKHNNWMLYFKTSRLKKGMLI